jgi:2-keto-4-pentenoate hydratase/2-oxohepta-3-ene-1,7-dioic acid hydratase in catechol pathway
MTRLCAYKKDAAVRVGIMLDGAVADLNRACEAASAGGTACSWRSMIDFLSAGAQAVQAAKAAEAWIASKGTDAKGADGHRVAFPLDAVKIMPVVPRPPKFICLAGNYLEHIREDRPDAEKPVDIHCFVKFPGTSVIATEDPIVVPTTITKLDYELEFGVVIGMRGRHIPLDRAVEHIGGYTVVNDVSDREYMPSPGKNIHWFAMKAQDNFGPHGPCLLLAGDVPCPPDLEMKLWVNGDLRQHSRTSYMEFHAAQIVHRLSRWITLEVGDIISTGTPAGNAWSRKDFLKDGDLIEAEIEGIGRLRNRVVFEEPTYQRG